MSKAPCRNCSDRYLGCHDHCEKYKAFDTERKRLHEIAAKQKQLTFDYYEVRKYHVRKVKPK